MLDGGINSCFTWYIGIEIKDYECFWDTIEECLRKLEVTSWEVNWFDLKFC